MKPFRAVKSIYPRMGLPGPAARIKPQCKHVEAILSMTGEILRKARNSHFALLVHSDIGLGRWKGADDGMGGGSVS
jgi:hypothetical protein